MATASSTGSKAVTARRVVVSAAIVAALAAPASVAANVTPGSNSAAAGCTQEDMRALVLELTSAAGPLSIEVAGVPRPGARRLTLSGLRRDPATPPSELARASLRRGDTVRWLSGTLILDRVAPGTDVSGSYDFRIAGDAPLRGRFHALWSNASADCG